MIEITIVFCKQHNLRWISCYHPISFLSANQWGPRFNWILGPTMTNSRLAESLIWGEWWSNRYLCTGTVIELSWPFQRWLMKGQREVIILISVCIIKSREIHLLSHNYTVPIKLYNHVLIVMPTVLPLSSAKGRVATVTKTGQPIK